MLRQQYEDDNTDTESVASSDTYISDDYDNVDDDIDNIDNVFAPEEPSTTKYNLVLCELYHHSLYGSYNNQNPNVDLHYIVNTRWKNFVAREIYPVCNFLNATLNNIARYSIHRLDPHPIRAYAQICSSHDCVKPEIAETYILPSGEMMCVLKTFWIRIIQRKWKKIYRERRNFLEISAM